MRWEAVSGAARYELWMWQDEATGWQLISDTLTGTSFTHTERTAGATYYYAIRALDAAGQPVSEWSQNVSATVPAASGTPPPAPTPTSTPPAKATLPPGSVLSTVLHEAADLTFEVPHNRITWDPVPGAIHYNLYYCAYTYSGFDPLSCLAASRARFRDRYALIASEISATTYLHRNVIQPRDDQSARYYYWVQPCFSRDCPYLTVLAAPTLNATAGADYVTLTWEPVAGAAAYELRAWWDENVGWQTIGGNLTGTAYAHENLSRGTYYYYLRALGPSGEQGEWSEQVYAAPGVLPAPALSAASTGPNTIVLSWDAVAAAASYELWSWASVTGWQHHGAALTGTSFTHENLTTGVTYYYTMRALGADGIPGAWSGYVNATPVPAGAPATAPVLVATPGPGLITLTWQPVASAAGYELWSWWADDVGWQRLGGVIEGTSFKHEDLTPGTTYLYLMRAVNANGAGPWSARLLVEPAAPLTATPTITPTPTQTATPTLTPTPTTPARPALPPPPSSLQLDPYYRKYLDAAGITIVASSDVEDAHLYGARDIIAAMLANRADLRASMVDYNFRVILFKNDGCRGVYQIPELRDRLPLGSCNQNTLGIANFLYDSDRRTGELLLVIDVYGVSPASQYCNSTFVHEFAHLVHYAFAIDAAFSTGRPLFDSAFDARVKSLYNAALAAGLYPEPAYARTRYEEYWAEAVTFWFLPNHLIGRVRTPAAVSTLADYDPRVAALVQVVFGNTALPACEPEYFKVLGTVTAPGGEPLAGVFVEASVRVFPRNASNWKQFWKSTLPTQAGGAYVIALSRSRLEGIQQVIRWQTGASDFDSFFILGVAGGEWDPARHCVAGYLSNVSGQVENISPGEAYEFAIPGGDLPGTNLKIAPYFDWTYRTNCLDAHFQQMKHN